MRYLSDLLARSKKSTARRATDVLQSKRRRRRLFVEQLEDRRLLATFTVINTTDNGIGSLRQAIVDANGNSGSDIIQFDSSVNGTITLTSGELAITDAVDLQGPGAGIVTVSGNNASRVFYVSASVTISGLTISGGNSGNGGGIDSDYGGGIYNENTLILESSNLAGNFAPYYGGGIFNSGTLTVNNNILSNNASSFQGGGIVNIGGTVSVESSTFSGNTAYDGGGINNRNGGTLTVHNSTFSGNSGSQYGGGISNNEGTLSVEASTFTGNSSGGGGGISNGSTATIRNSTFSGNSAGGGGAISTGSGNGGALTVENTTLSGNSAGAGGGISSGFNGSLTIRNSTLSGNSAGYGGGIYTLHSSTMTVFSSTLSGNTADYDRGGGIYLSSTGTSTLYNTIVAANFVAVKYNEDINGTITSSSSHNLIGSNRNLSGVSDGTNGNQIGTVAMPINPMLGALQDNGGATKTMAILPGSPVLNAGDDSLIPIGITNDQRGIGFARIESGTVDIGAYEYVVANDPPEIFIVNTLADTEDANPAVTSLREAIRSANDHPGADIIRFAPGLTGTIILTSGELAVSDDSVDIQGPGANVVTVSGNNASRVFYVTANATISGLTISGGSSTNGGGIYNAFGTLTVQNSTLSGNSADIGGGIYNAYGALSVDSSTFSGNSASTSSNNYDGGGGIFNANYGTHTIVQNSIFTDNSAFNLASFSLVGGGINNVGTLTVDSSTFSGNTASSEGGGLFNWGTLAVVNSTLSSNSAGGAPGSNGAGGGILNFNMLTMDNSTLSDNYASYQGGGIENRGASTLTVNNSTFIGNSGHYYGGGIKSDGTLTVDNSSFISNTAAFGAGILSGSGTAVVHNSTLSGNSASNTGGAIYNRGLMTVDSSALSSNKANDGGGGIANLWSGILNVQSSTLNGNSAGDGGGIQSGHDGTLTVRNSTLSGNTAHNNRGGGIYSISSGTSTLYNSIVAANFGHNDVYGTIANSSSHNLIGSNRNLSGVSDGSNGNQIGTATMSINPMLGALQDNGGPTHTMAILPGSPAINAGDNSLIPIGIITDQRGTGYDRIDSGIVDIGAFELVLNRPPTVGDPTVPDPIAVNTTINMSANFTDPDLQDTHTAVWDWGDASTSTGTVSETNGSGSVGGSHVYSAAGVYSVTLTVTDNHNLAATSSSSYIVVYDPSAGFVTGGGWINSPVGAYTANPALSGKATFGFVSQYQNGNNVPTGNTDFQFKLANFNFKSTSYEWLVVSGAKARFRGVGSVNGAGGYDFELTAIDGQVNGGGGADTFRIKIWLGNQGNGVVYDNNMGAVDGADPTTALGGGSIVIHKNSKPLMAAGGVTIGSGSGSLTQESLNQAVGQAIDYWQNTGVDASAVSKLQQIHVEVADLSDTELGIASDTDYVWIDRDAAGYGWQLDSLGSNYSSLTGGMDLLSVVAHELGHKLGLEHSHDDSDIMAPTLDFGVRKMVGIVSQPLAFFNTSLVLSGSIQFDGTSRSVGGTLQLPKEDLEEIQARDQLFATLDDSPTKPLARSPIIASKSQSDAKPKPASVDEDLLDGDFLEAIALAQRATHRQNN